MIPSWSERIEPDFQTTLSIRTVALRPLLDIRGLSRTHTCPWQLNTMGFNAGLPGFLLCQPGWLDRSVAHWLVGLLAGWLTPGISIQVMPYCAHPVQHKGLIRDAKQQARVFTELKRTTALDEPAPLQTWCLSVPVFARLLCHEME